MAIARQKSSDVIMKGPQGRYAIVPVHKGEPLGPGILRKIISTAGLNVEKFTEFLKGR